MGITGRIFCYLGLILLIGCGGPSRFVHPATNLDLVKRVAILPFDNLSNEKNAGEIVQDIFTTELLAEGVFRVVEHGEVARVMREKGISPNKGLSAPEARVMGSSLNVQGVILGTVDVYEMARGGGGSLSYPLVAFSARLIEVEKGEVIWQASHSGSGLTLFYRFFGMGGKEISTVTREVADALLKTLK